MLAVAMNDAKGMVDFAVRDTTRKRFTEQEATIRDKDIASWVELPTDYAKQLVQESVDVARSSGGSVPPAYQIWAELIGGVRHSHQQLTDQLGVGALARVLPRRDAWLDAQ